MAPSRQTYSRTAPGYPRRLVGVAGAPEFLRVLGTLTDAGTCVAIVGARAASGHGMAAARELAAAAGERGWAVVSGGAVGIDASAHRGALDAGVPGATVAVLGSGLSKLYPASNRSLFGRIVAEGGAVASPFDDDLSPRPGTFVTRNRVIAGMVDAVIVVEAGAASGALHTASFARDLGRAVAAVPGTPGTQALIAQGAAVVDSIGDLDALLAGAPRRPRVELPAGGTDEAAVLGALADAPRAPDEVARLTGLAPREVSRALTGLELEGLALLAPGHCYVRSTLARELLVR